MPAVTTKKKNVSLPFAGRYWTFLEVEYVTLPGGKEGICAVELQRLRRLVAEQIQAKKRRTPEEQDFLTDWLYEQA